MKTPDKYRFTLQWGADSEEKIRAGDFLESLGNRKSELVVLAVTEYLSAHPEALGSGQKLQIVVKPSFTRDQIRTMIQDMVEEKIASMASAPREAEDPGSGPMAVEPDIDEMLKNLDIFSQ